MGSASSTSLLLWAASFVARAASNAVEFETRERLGPGALRQLVGSLLRAEPRERDKASGL